MSEEPIVSFSGEYRWLSNFYMSPVVMASPHPTLAPFIYASVEHAYQAAKPVARCDHDAIAKTSTAGRAKTLGRLLTPRQDWDDVKDDVMTSAVAAKFAPGSPLAFRLLLTGNARLVEGNHWGDLYWGMCSRTGVGENRLGEILMACRTHLSALGEKP